MWYVVQVVGGREETARHLIDKFVDAGTYKEVFVPRYRATQKVDGELKYYHPVLTPGYVIVDTTKVDAFESQLRCVPAFTRLLGNNECFKALDREERAWLEEWTKPNERVVQGSIGRINKGKLKILSGPLVGMEGRVVKVNRRKKKATVLMNVMGRPKEISLELEIIGKTTE